MNVEIWSDVFCPFCYIGKRHFEIALETFPHRDQVNITWRSFQLQPDAPLEADYSTNEMLSRKYGISIDEARGMQANVSQRAAAVGLNYDLENSQITNSFDAHRLTHLAKARGLQDAAEERFFKAYFIESKHVGRRESLIELGKEIGLLEPEIIDVLDSDRYAADVREDVALGSSFGLTGVPFFVFERKYAVAGAQPPEVFSQVLDHVWSEIKPVQLVTAAAPAEGCDDGSCAVPGMTGAAHIATK
jgi:predicted DsbA family dithiol-disulfide isomerase